jgi:diguanylate cyclase (GGDEF)-like protein
VSSPTTADPSRRDSDRAAWPGEKTTKRGLQLLSRSIERVAEDIATSGEDVSIVGLFQRPEYYEQSRHVYERLARRADVTAGHVLAGYEGTGDEPTPVDMLLLPDGHDLGEQWAVLVVSPRLCLGLVAFDTGESGIGMSVEAARLFATELSTDPDVVRRWVRRFLDQAAGLLGAEAVGRLRGAVERGGQDGDDVDRIVASALEATWARSLSTVGALQRSERLMLSDPLTGALNRRFLDRYFESQGSRAPSIAAAAFDFDGFKLLNDTYGHAVGDEALRAFAALVRANVRDADALIRLGGDEWLLLLPGIGLDDAVSRVRRILDEAAGHELSAPGARIRASAGIGVFAAAEVDLDAVDRALYRAKGSDDRVAVVEGPG